MNNKLVILLILLVAAVGVYLVITGDQVGDEVDNNEQSQVNEEVTDYSFVEEGVIVYGNPGMEEGVYHLVYDKPGAPGANVELVFQDDSDCKMVESGDCGSIFEIKEKRVKIQGNPVSDDLSEGVVVGILELIEE